MKKIAFDKIGAVIAEHIFNINKIELDVFKSDRNIEYEYIVVTFKGGSISVRNASYNSLTTNIRELGKLLDGGYYKEVEEYKKLKGKV